MTTPRKNRRAVMAELLLLANPTAIRVRSDGTSLDVNFDSIAELRSWLHLAGLDGPDVLFGKEHQGADSDGRPYRAVNAYPTWHGWKIYAHATEYTDRGAHLDASTTDRLAALAVA
ncbi:hypothetical protein GA0070604_5324 [Micromonospora eburnea]|uniref:Uncharacterized protein n=2 Tax=Micromonospora eburnea TaxID=227316 RepID=A0A1C6VFW4_9ACTN|nr:hypothetical protein GA0070604_5324 [Micromonospora eburnea]